MSAKRVHATQASDSVTKPVAAIFIRVYPHPQVTHPSLGERP